MHRSVATRGKSVEGLPLDEVIKYGGLPGVLLALFVAYVWLSRDREGRLYEGFRERESKLYEARITDLSAIKETVQLVGKTLDPLTTAVETRNRLIEAFTGELQRLRDVVDRQSQEITRLNEQIIRAGRG